MSRASRTTRVVAAAALALGLSAACGGDDDHDIAAGPTACYLDSKPFVDAVDDDHFATRYNNVELPLERGDASSSIGFQCDISIDGEDVLSLTANFEDQANIKQEDLMAIRTAGAPSFTARGRAMWSSTPIASTGYGAANPSAQAFLSNEAIPTP